MKVAKTPIKRGCHFVERIMLQKVIEIERARFDKVIAKKNKMAQFFCLAIYVGGYGATSVGR